MFPIRLLFLIGFCTDLGVKWVACLFSMDNPKIGIQAAHTTHGSPLGLDAQEGPQFYDDACELTPSWASPMVPWTFLG